MNIPNLIVLAILLSLMLLAVQRGEKKRRWLIALVLLGPSGFLIYRWALYKNQVQETLVAAGIAVALNLLFWIAYGRTHPPLSSDEIHVAGMEE
jgi:hypothetical protein